MSAAALEAEVDSRTLPENSFDVILPAGGRISGDFAGIAGADIKALIQIDGETILARTIRAFRGVPQVRKILVVGPEPALVVARASGVDAAILEEASGPKNIYLGLRALPVRTGGRGCDTVIAATDLPFLSSEAILSFLSACPSTVQAAVAVIRSEAFESRFAGSVNQYIRIADGAYTFGGLFLVNNAMTLQNEAYVEKLFHARKSPWRMAQVIGLRIAVKFASGRLTIDDIVARCGALANCRGMAIPGMPAELAFDIDDPIDYDYALAHTVPQVSRVSVA